MSASSGVTRGYGSTVRIGVGETPTWTKLVGVEEFDFPDQTPDDIDTTHLESPGDTEESINGMKKAVDWDLAIQYAPGSATDVLLTGLMVSGEDFLLEIKAVGATERTWAAYVKSYRPTGINAKSKMMATAKIRVKAEVID
ncbi:phage tail tube protein [Albirhodobacter sp. R86504]|uniref:phage tail tube protein n=1 Tax=Albirhodobacter sp. R86504 TaxID=3093848 RepID=UPI00366C0176